MLVNWFFIAKITEAYLSYSNLMASSINSGVTLGSEVQKTTSLLAMYSGVVIMLCIFDIYCYYCVWAVIGTFEKTSDTTYSELASQRQRQDNEIATPNFPRNQF